jgi:hypothetical protein
MVGITEIKDGATIKQNRNKAKRHVESCTLGPETENESR